jgi:hypothetical protein
MCPCEPEITRLVPLPSRIRPRGDRVGWADRRIGSAGSVWSRLGHAEHLTALCRIPRCRAPVEHASRVHGRCVSATRRREHERRILGANDFNPAADWTFHQNDPYLSSVSAFHHPCAVGRRGPLETAARGAPERIGVLILDGTSFPKQCIAATLRGRRAPAF